MNQEQLGILVEVSVFIIGIFLVFVIDYYFHKKRK